MATFDQLPAEQRAIIELVLQRRQSYGDLAGMLGMSEARVRELAREALTDLSPHSAARVDDDWRGQVADYLLGQQTGPEGTATRGHLKRSEAARLWALSLIDSLDHLYQGNEIPVIPEGEAGPAPSRAPRVREPRPARPLTPDAEAIVKRRRMLAGGAAAAIVVFGLLVWPVGLLGGDDDGGGDSEQADSPEAALVGQLLLRPQEGEKGVAIAVVQEGEDGELVLIVQGRGLQRTQRGEAYEVWLYNSNEDAQSMGAQLTDRQGNYQGAGRLPDDYEKYKFLDISREKVADQNPAHSGDSVLRGSLADIQSGEAAQPLEE